MKRQEVQSIAERRVDRPKTDARTARLLDTKGMQRREMRSLAVAKWREPRA